MTHDELCRRAERWLRNTKGCGFALRELRTFAVETPDAIGWRDGCISHLVECKVTRADFLSDAKKPFRAHPEMGLGMFRWYFCPRGIITPDDLPEHWGLLYSHNRSVRVIVEATMQPAHHMRNEMTMLTSALRRVQLNGDLGQILND